MQLGSVSVPYCTLVAFPLLSIPLSRLLIHFPLLELYVYLLHSCMCVCMCVCTVSTSKGLYSRRSSGAQALDEAAGKAGMQRVGELT